MTDGNGSANFISANGTQLAGSIVESAEGLIDINGDGLPDHWLAQSGGTANVALNYGEKHKLFSVLETGELTSPVKPGSDATHTGTLFDGMNRPLEGNSFAKLRPVDVDHDGRLDMVSWTTSGMVRFNGGGQFIASAQPFPGAGHQDGVRRPTVATQTGDLSGEPYVWELKGDLIDLDGNGIAEAASFGSTFRRVVEAQTSPPRLLITVNNGRGLVSQVTYAHMHDPTTVDQQSGEMWGDVPCPGNTPCRPKASPRQQWVVKSLAVADSYAGTTATTSQHYANPRFAVDDEARYGFRGFERVTTTSPTGARSVQRFDYAVDWSGRLAAELVMPATGVGETTVTDEVRSVRRLSWEPRTLFSGTVTTFHETGSESFTCNNGQTEAACVAAPAGYVRTLTTLQGLVGHLTGSAVLLWQETKKRVQAQSAAADGDRVTSTSFFVYADTTGYRVRPTSTQREHQAGGALVLFGKSARSWSADYRVPLTEETWFDGNDANRAITSFAYDLATGNLIERTKPEQAASSGASTSFAYDSRKLFVSWEENELGHRLDYGWEYGTGTKILTDGPNQRACVTGTYCPLDATHPLREQRSIKIDGLGRMLERWEPFSDDGNLYTLHKVETNTFTDTPSPSAASSVFHTQLINTFATTTIQSRADTDGHGRPLRETVYVQGTAPYNQITTYVYNHSGTLQRVYVPDPSLNTTATVAYSYTYDSLGRPTSVRRPDTTSVASQSGLNMTYSGLTSTTTEETGSAGGHEASSKRVTDSFGRLVKVHEQTGTSSWATTTYTHGPDDMVSDVTDPQGVLTKLSHDFGGRRIEVSRQGEQWLYAYDRNGNLRAETVPGGTGPLDLNYTTFIDYDPLDRPISKDIGQRALSAADQAAFGSRTEIFTYDTGNGMKGRLRTWTSYNQSGIAANSATYTTDASSNPVSTSQTFQGAGYPSRTRSITERWSAHGSRRAMDYGDPMSSNYRTYSYTNFDARGLPVNVDVRDATATMIRSSRIVAQQSRNVAGLVTSRSTTLTSGSVLSSWTYDKLGRVLNQTVQKPGIAVVVRQDLAYHGNDNPAWLTHQLGNNSRHFNYTYDLRHQLTGVSTTTTGYFGATYQYGASGRFTRAIETRTISPLNDIKPRDVNYVYGGTDPEQVTALTVASGPTTGQTWASYTYDRAGNQLTRSYPGTGETWQYVYDGKDQLRRATRRVNNVSQGSEEYWYDGAGQRTQVVKRDSLGNRLELIWFLKDVQAHYNAAGTVTRVFSNISLGTPVARVDRTGIAAPAFELQFHGLASNTIAAVAINGTVNASFSYSPFGAVLEATDAGGTATGVAAHKRRMNDKYVDDVSSLAYYGARYYDRTLMGWTQADPLYLRLPDLGSQSTPRRSLLHTFSLNNPLRYIDPDGLDSRPSISNYQSQIEASAAGRASNMMSDGGDQSYTCANFSNACYEESGGGGANSGVSYGDMRGEMCNGVTSVCNGPAKLAAGVARAAQGCGPRCAGLVTTANSVSKSADRFARRANKAIEGGASAVFASVLDVTRSSGGAAVVRAGQAGEAAVRSVADIGPKVLIRVAGRGRIPDGLTSTVLSEVKNVGFQAFTQQLRDFAAHASKHNLRFDLWMRPNTIPSRPLARELASGAINLKTIP